MFLMGFFMCYLFTMRHKHPKAAPSVTAKQILSHCRLPSTYWCYKAESKYVLVYLLDGWVKTEWVNLADSKGGSDASFPDSARCPSLPTTLEPNPPGLSPSGEPCGHCVSSPLFSTLVCPWEGWAGVLSSQHQTTPFIPFDGLREVWWGYFHNQWGSPVTLNMESLKRIGLCKLDIDGVMINWLWAFVNMQL